MKSTWRSPGTIAALIVALTFVAYIPAMHGGFLWDDNYYLSDNEITRTGNGLYRAWFTTEAPDYYPLTWSLWWLEWRLWGDAATGYHVVNVLLHSVNAVLAWMIFQRLRIPGALLVALVFALHPVNVATVAWISEQKNTLSMLFYAVSILLYLRFDNQGQRRWYGLSVAAFVLALLAKSAVVMLPVALLGCIWLRHGTVRWKDTLSTVPFFALSLVFGLVTIWFQYNRALEGNIVRSDGFLHRLAVAGWSLWFYLYKALLPLNLTVIYPQWNVDASRLVSYLPCVTLVGVFTFFWLNRRTWGRACFVGLGYFAATLFPVLGFFDQRWYQSSWVADHWQYYGIIAPAALVVAAGNLATRRFGERGHYWAGVIGVVVLILLGGGAWRRGQLYANAEMLWRDNIARNPVAFKPYNNLGFVLAQAGRVDEAVAQFNQSLRLKPDFEDAYYNRGCALAQSGQMQEAVKDLEQAVRLGPRDARAHNNLANALVALNRISEAVPHYEQALRLRPDLADAHFNLGLTLEKTGRTKEAIEQYKLALKFDPRMEDAQKSLVRLQAVQ